MKFAIFREFESGKRKFLVEWNKDQIINALCCELSGESDDRIRAAFDKIIENFKRESAKIP